MSTRLVMKMLAALLMVVLVAGSVPISPTTVRAQESSEVVYFFPDLTVETGDTWTREIVIPETPNIFITLQKTTLVSYGNSWSAKLSLLRGAEEIASDGGSHDLILHIMDPEPGAYTLSIQASRSGSGILTVRTELPELPLGEWVVGTVHCSYGSTWYQIDVPASLEGLYLEAEAMGLWSHFDIYYQEYGSSRHWVSRQGTETALEIRDPDPGVYIVEFTDSAMQWAGSRWSGDQSRDVLIRAGTTTRHEDVSFPMGDKSFADEVVTYQSGSRVAEPYNDPGAALESPDWSPRQDDKFCSLGDGGTLTVRFTDNYLVDVDGPDLYVFEIGGVEPFRVEISTDGSSWIELGTVQGQPTSLDIRGKVAPGERFQYVRLTDVNAGITEHPWAGADIDAVGAIGAKEAQFAPPGYRPYITTYSPTSGGNTGTVTVEIKGGWLDPQGTVSLVDTGHPGLTAREVRGSPDRTTLWATFDLRGSEPQEWGLEVRNPDGQSAYAPGSFIVDEGGKPSLSVDVIGRSQLRVRRYQTYIVRVENTGPVDAYDYVLTIELPRGLDFSLDTPSEIDERVPLAIEQEGTRAIPIWIPKLGAGERWDIPLRVQASSESAVEEGVYISVALGEAPRSAYSASGRFEDINTSPTFLGIRDAILEAILEVAPPPTSLDHTRSPHALLVSDVSLPRAQPPPGSGRELYDPEAAEQSITDYVWDLASTAVVPSWKGMAIGGLIGVAVATLPVWAPAWLGIASATVWLSPWIGGVIGAGLGATAEMGLGIFWANKKLTDSMISKLDMDLAYSTTPEDKYGPTGYDPPGRAYEERQRFVPADQGFYYKVDFWNKEDAPAPAADVLVKDQLDTDFDWNTFRFEEVGFLRWTVPLDPSQYFNINVDMRPDMDLIVNVEGTFDPGSGEAEWIFRSLVPDTLDVPEDPMAGFLPPITESGYEVGWVGFSVKPQGDLTNGTRIENQAFVEFDAAGDLLDHPAPKDGPFLNTVDSLPPSSEVTATRDGDGIQLHWTGDDLTGSGIGSYSVYVSEDGGAFEPWLVGTTDSSGSYPGESANTYAFYSIAVDNAGNVEEPPDAPDATTLPEETALWLWVVVGVAAFVAIGGGFYAWSRRRAQ